MKDLLRKFCFRVSGNLAHRRPGRGFTLIELLVVIAIIALLLSIIVPAVNLAKRKAATAVCLIHARQMSLAWYTYQDENRGRLVNGNIGPGSWVDVPQDAQGKPRGLEEPADNPVTDDDEKRGIIKGTLYPYLEAPDVMHCPADNLRKSRTDQTNIYRTYSIPRAVSAGVTKFVQISQPGERYNFVEEADPRCWNFGTWDLKTPFDSPAWEWQDVLAVNHGESSILAFCDAHAEIHKWQDDHTKERVKIFLENTGLKDTAALNAFWPRPPGVETDLMYMAAGWAYRGR